MQSARLVAAVAGPLHVKTLPIVYTDSTDTIPWLQVRPRWVACIDLLGFTNMVCESDWATVISTYEQSLEELVDLSGMTSRVEHAWFSDTFILYTHDDSAACFGEIEIRARSFTNGLIMKRIPLRGALSCGSFFAHKESSIFIGPALVDAYRLCEDQDWIGFALSPLATRRMREVGRPPEESRHYRYWRIPRKTGNEPKGEWPALLALLLGGPSLELDRNLCYTRLREMRELITNENVRPKYDHTIDFLERMRTIHTVA